MIDGLNFSRFYGNKFTWTVAASAGWSMEIPHDWTRTICVSLMVDAYGNAWYRATDTLGLAFFSGFDSCDL
jgi:hypothetical protein